MRGCLSQPAAQSPFCATLQLLPSQETISAAGLVGGSILHHLPRHTAHLYTIPKEGSTELTLLFIIRSFLCAEESSLSTQANTQLNEWGWGSVPSKWTLYNEMYLSALPTHVLILPINTTPPFTSGFCLTPLLHSIGNNMGDPQHQGSTFSAKPHKQQ